MDSRDRQHAVTPTDILGAESNRINRIGWIALHCEDGIHRPVHKPEARGFQGNEPGRTPHPACPGLALEEIP